VAYLGIDETRPDLGEVRARRHQRRPVSSAPLS
jgi:hypothetical protein